MCGFMEGRVGVWVDVYLVVTGCTEELIAPGLRFAFICGFPPEAIQLRDKRGNAKLTEDYQARAAQRAFAARG